MSHDPSALAFLLLVSLSGDSCPTWCHVSVPAGSLASEGPAGGPAGPKQHRRAATAHVLAPSCTGLRCHGLLARVSKRGRPSVCPQTRLRHVGTPGGLRPPTLGLRLSSASLSPRHLQSLGDRLGAPSRFALTGRMENPAHECHTAVRASDSI